MLQVLDADVLSVKLYAMQFQTLVITKVENMLKNEYGNNNHNDHRCKQEGQHPLTEQRATNFMLLANQ